MNFHFGPKCSINPILILSLMVSVFVNSVWNSCVNQLLYISETDNLTVPHTDWTTRCMTAWLSVSLWLLVPANRKQHVNRMNVNMLTDSLWFYHSWHSAAASVCHWGETITTLSSSEWTHEEETTTSLTDGLSFSLCDQRHSAASDLLSVSHAQERERVSIVLSGVDCSLQQQESLGCVFVSPL